jgi:hypothetical protein
MKKILVTIKAGTGINFISELSRVWLVVLWDGSIIFHEEGGQSCFMEHCWV